MTKKNDERVKILMDQLSVAYNDPGVQAVPDFKVMIMNAAKELQKEHNPALVSTRLHKAIIAAYWAHRQVFPAALNTLYDQLSSATMKYDATAIATMLLPVWFH